jgi:hypothetical protein
VNDISLILKLFIVIGVLVFTAGLLDWDGKQAFVARAVHVDGTVVAIRGPAGSFRSYPVVRYADPQGHTHLLDAHESSAPSAYTVGEKVSVLIDPEDPNVEDTATIDGFFELWGGSTILMALGATFVLIALGVRYMHGRGGDI